MAPTAAEWKIDPAKIDIVGFSAGGELAALTAMTYQNMRPETKKVDKNTPSAFLMHAAISVNFYLDLKKAVVSAELHVHYQ